VVAALLVLGDLVEVTCLVEFYVACHAAHADLVVGYG
jgi:hypothetical protein